MPHTMSSLKTPSTNTRVSQRTKAAPAVSKKKDADLSRTPTSTAAAAGFHTPMKEVSVTEPQTKSKRTPPADLKDCPCGIKISTGTHKWMIDCSECKQFWHLPCVSLDGLTGKEINKMLNYKCPFCYVAPIPTVKPIMPSTCFTCRNTEVLRNINHEHEMSIAAHNMKEIFTSFTSLGKLDMESLNRNVSTIRDFDSHLSHLLLKEDKLVAYQDSVHKIEADIATINEAIQKFSPDAPKPPDFKPITDQIEALQTEISRLNQPSEQPLIPPTSCDGEKLADIASKLDCLYNKESAISAQFDDIKSTMDRIVKTPPVAVSAPQALSAPPASQNTVPPKLPHNEKHVESYTLDFMDDAGAKDLVAFVSGLPSLRAESGHTVVSFGEPYSYTGSPKDAQPAAIPEPIKGVVDTINRTICAKLPQINQCLVNCYRGPDAFLPEHADDEQSIHPESLICTLSLGSRCTVKFRESDTGQEETVVCDHASLYSMTKRSQGFYQHRIETGSIVEGTRYSLTFRSVSRANKNSTCVIGDSNTGGIKFGTGKGTLGYHMPGKQVFAPHVNNINPLTCLAYSNVVIGGLYRPSRRLGSRFPGSVTNERRYSRADDRRLSVSSRDTRGWEPTPLTTEGYQGD